MDNLNLNFTDYIAIAHIANKKCNIFQIDSESEQAKIILNDSINEYLLLSDEEKNKLIIEATSNLVIRGLQLFKILPTL